MRTATDRRGTGTEDAVALGEASYAIYDTEELRGEFNNATEQINAVSHLLTATVGDVDKLSEISRQLQEASVAESNELTIMARYLKIQSATDELLAYTRSLTTGILAILDRRISPSLIRPDEGSKAFTKLTKRAEQAGLHPVVEDFRQIYQLPASFRTGEEGGLEVVIKVPLRQEEYSPGT